MEAADAYESLQQEIDRAQEGIENYVDTQVKPEIDTYFETFMEGNVEDLRTVQVRRNAPKPDATGYLPEFWYESDDTGCLVTYAKLVSPSSVFSDLRLSRNSNWSTGTYWTISGTASYDSTKVPSAIDTIGVMMNLEDGSKIVTEEKHTSDFSGTAPADVTFTGIQPEYEERTKTIYWNLGRVRSWDELTEGKCTVANIQVTDGTLTQEFGVELTLRDANASVSS